MFVLLLLLLLRASPKSAALWEGLAAAYQALGRHASALKSYGRALDLDAARPYSLMSAGLLEYMAGQQQPSSNRHPLSVQLWWLQLLFLACSANCSDSICSLVCSVTMPPLCLLSASLLECRGL